MKFKWLYFSVSLLVIIPGVISLVLFGLRPAIDFTGGSLVELRLTAHPGKTVTEEGLRDLASREQVTMSMIQLTQNSVLLRTAPLTQAQLEIFKQSIKDNLADVEEVRFETVGPTLGKELLTKTVVALVLAAALILLFIVYRFKNWKFGICAVLAVLHDTLVILGSFSLLGHFKGVEIDTLFVTAVLTILSFSVYDTIVVYDRVRETKKLYPKMDFTSLVNHAVTTTLARSINNSMTIIFMLVALFLLGGETIHWFALALLIGSVSGTYSSTFTAAPLLVVWEELAKSRIRVSK